MTAVTRNTAGSWQSLIRDFAVKWRWPLLLLGSVLLGLTVIFPQIGSLEWIALIPALLPILTLTPDPTVKYRRLYGWGLIFFWVFYAINFHWFLYMYPLDFAGMSHAASAVVVGFACLGLSLFQALGAALLFPLMGLATRGKWVSRHPLLHPLLFACLWTTLEWWQAHSGWSGVPWARLSLGQAEAVSLLQSASLFGSYFVTFLIVAVGGLLTGLLMHPEKRVICAALALGLFFGNMTFGIIRMAAMKDEGITIQAAAIQGNKGSLENWSAGSMDQVMEVYGELSKAAAAEGADIIVWPETCIPANIDRQAWVYEYVTDLSRECGVPILCGLFTRVEEGSEADYNSIVVALPDGTVHDTVYNKRNPVPFGEFVPFRNLVMTLVPPLAEINTLAEDIPAGEESVVFDLEVGQVGSLICFDSIYEQNALDSIANGAQLLAVSTNDSWFTDSRGVWMHHAQSQLRAIETGRYVVRSANTGVSSIINDRGEVLETLAPLKTGYVLDAVVLSERVTVYSVIGNVFAYACLVLCAAAVFLSPIEQIAARLTRRQSKTEN
ncbi:MAG: apolipoprotein N-acyltransferase [Clostridia bacterium]|nr:apolipoprotein N-acyltransferase [Clostridia bacterium]